ncbi:methylamine utilization protein MauE [Actinomadura sp. NAK00032]|uniref:MauE/DoxX family redox-associated membrane protein n=1 Tax=Actinomadura sp. NAK00032 TaxID=2742128 RepID=UPI00159184FD|nr:MauE/DoxX family redox-associated membrane protein [Actinomadura sp. NAK00032]QKW38524.1 methylamine utilization protein MauE [Actinomadura sp. NAK00032]
MLFVSLACRLALAAVMTLAAVAKLRAPGAFAASLEGLDFVPARLRRPLAVLVPAAELLIVLLLALPATVTAGFLAAALFCCGLTAVPTLVVVRGQKVACACFGTSEVPMGGVHIVRNAALLAVACLGAAVALTRGGGVPGEPPGIALAVVAAGLLTTLTVFVDDIAALLRPPVAAGDRGR